MKDFRYLLRHRIEQLRRRMERPRRFAPVRRAKPRIRRLAHATRLEAAPVAGLGLPLDAVTRRAGQQPPPASPQATA
ncbi:hypothetical protein AMQ83_09040 [Paenibacillus riograndensis]|nr:hypothetical protein AMQ83_09040 [Paenibacillus riograndensis]